MNAYAHKGFREEAFVFGRTPRYAGRLVQR